MSWLGPGPDHASGSADRTPALAGPGRLAGRGDSLAELTALATHAGGGRGAVALVTGEPGIGKTRLARELTAQVDLPSGWGGCWEGMSTPPLWPWRTAFTQLDAHDLAAVLSGLSAGEDAGDAVATRYGRFAEVTARLKARGPALIVIDDFHWADLATLELLKVVAAEAYGLPLAMVVLSRSPLDDVPVGLHLALGGLDRDAVEQLAPGRPAAEVARIHRLSGGNPLYAIELARAGAAAGRSPALSEIIRRRLSGVSAPVRELLDLAAVVGPEESVELLAQAAGSDVASLAGLLRDAVNAPLLELSGDRWSFRHEVIREGLLQQMAPDRRTHMHGAVARALIAGSAADPARVAHHLVAADPRERDGTAVTWARAAGDAATAALAFDDAARWYRAAARRRPSFPVTLALGEALAQAGDMAGARGAFDEAAGIARRDARFDQLASAALSFGAGLSGFEVRLFDHHQIELLEEALAGLPDDEDRLRALVQAQLSTALSFIEPVPRRIELSRDAVVRARRCGDPSTRVMCLAAHLDATAGPDHAAGRLDLVAEMLAAAEQARSPHREALARRFHIVALAERGLLAELDRELIAYAVVAERLRAPLYGWYVPMFRAMRAMWERRWDDAARLSAAAAELGRAAGSENAALLALSQDASRAFFVGDWARFDELYQRALSAHPTISEHPSTRAMLAAAAVRRGDPGSARGVVEALTADGCAAVLDDSSRLETLVKLAHAVAGLADVTYATPVRAALVPYDGLWAFDGTASICWGPVRAALAALDRTLQDGSKPGTAKRGDSAKGEAEPGRLRRRGDAWEVAWGGVDVMIGDSKGVRDLAVLLANPHVPVAAVDLDGRVRSASTSFVADRRAIDAYRRRLVVLAAEVDEADADNDVERAARARAEQDALLAELGASVGLAGRPRRMADDTERARQAVFARLRRTIERLGRAHPALGRHLRASVRTGAACSYEPERDVVWVVDWSRR